MRAADPTARGDAVSVRVRAWYEANRETWFQRHALGMILTGHALGATPDRYGEHADEFMLSLIAAVHEAEQVVAGGW